MLPVNFKVIEDILNIDIIPEFDICSRKSGTFSMMRLQCKANIIADLVNGVRSEEQSHYNLCINAINKAIENNSDILITPEYSIPLKLVTKIVQDSNLQPKSHKIFCLSCGATTVQAFRNLLDAWETDGAYVVRYALDNNAQEKKFVNALIYVFKLSNSKLCILPQLKTKYMADPFLKCEAGGLTLGSTIYVFGRDNPNRFCSLICADVLNDEIDRTQFQPTGNEHIVVFHPQLNPHPRHTTFSSFRHRFYELSSGSKVIYITANWAEGTTVKDAQSSETETFLNPWSCVYIKNSNENWITSLSKLIASNHCLGIGFSYWEKYRVNIWYSFKEENMQEICIKKPNLTGTCVLRPSEVVGINTYIPSARKDSWEQYRACFTETLPSIIPNLPPKFCYPCTATTAQRDRFFGLCFGNFEEGQYIADDCELCARMGVYIDDECQKIRDENAIQFMRFVSYLKKVAQDVYSGGLSFSFGLSDTLPNYNIFLEPRNEDEDDKGMLATYLEYELDNGIRALTKRLSDKLNFSEYKRTIIITTDPITIIPKILYLKMDKGISTIQRKKNLTSIVRS